MSQKGVSFELKTVNHTLSRREYSDFLLMSLKLQAVEMYEKITKNISQSIKNSKYCNGFNILIFPIMCTLCLLTVFNGVKNYLRFDVVSQTRVLEEVPLLFPTVTICSLNSFETEQAANLAKNIIENEFNQDLSDNENLTSADYLTLIEIANAISLSHVNNPDYGDDRRKELGFPLSDILFKCIYNKNKCDIDDFEWYFDFHFGNCFKFNSGYNRTHDTVPLKYSTIPGEKNGLFMSFFLPNSKNRYSASNSNGLRIFVHDASVSPSSSEGINVKSATMTNIAIKRTIINKAPQPYSDCIDIKTSYNSILYNHIINSNKDYRQTDCFDLCLQKNIIESCKCYYLEYPKINNSAPCLNTSQLLCASHQYTIFIEANVKKDCSKFCPLECNSVSNDLFLSSSDFPTENLYQILKKDKNFKEKYFNKSEITYSMLKEKGFAVNIFYPHLKYTVITELEKITIIDLLAGIGGTLGLFLGLSIRHLIKIVEKLVQITIAIYKKSCNQISNA